MTYKLSPSTLKILRDCPKCFYLKVKEKIPRPRGIFPSLPGGMDKLIKEYYDSLRGTDTLPEGLEEFQDKYRLYDDVNQLSEWRNNFRGISWQDADGNLLRGAVDDILVSKSTEKLVVVDYKTRGFPLKGIEHTYFQDQLDLYNFLLRKNNYETEDFSLLVYYHPNSVLGSKVEFNIDILNVDISVTNAEGLFEEALEVLSGEIPESSEKCEYCSWKKKSR